MPRQPHSPNGGALWQAIAEFDIDGGQRCELTFAERLSREQSWSAAYTARAIAEYKRFMFLAVTAGHPVSPSEEVDGVWHLHLTYTRSYWQRFCGQTLGTDMHHDPTRGGSEEAAKHQDMYAQTLARYREVFGEAPPEDIWPPTERRFAGRPAWRMEVGARAAIIAAIALIAVLAATVHSLAAWPFDLEGMSFFGVLVPALVLALLAGLLVRFVLRGTQDAGGTTHAKQPLDWAEAAFLAGGPPRLAAAAIARLVAVGAATIDARGTLVAGQSSPTGLSPVEEAAYGMLPFKKGSGAQRVREMQRLNNRVDGAFAPRYRSLVERGLALAPGQAWRASKLALAPFAAVLLGLGLPRLIFGWSSGKPVAYLVLVLIGAIFLGWLLFFGLAPNAYASRAGEAALKRAKSATNRFADVQIGSAQDGDAGAMLVALFGPAVLAGSAMVALHDWLPRPAAASGSSGCATATGCGSGGGGGGGCSGCGGGGGN